MGFNDTPLYEVVDDVALHEPVLIVSLEGWVDAGLGASTALSSILESSPTELLATFDGDQLLDQRARRPMARIVDGITTSLTWPEIQLRVPEPEHLVAHVTVKAVGGLTSRKGVLGHASFPISAAMAGGGGRRELAMNINAYHGAWVWCVVV